MLMENETLDELKKWFDDYVATFKSGDVESDFNVVLKEEHSRRVCREILYIGENLRLSENNLLLAEIMALLHDIGRFQQYTQYRTFVDHLSVNHAEFGVKILREKQTLWRLEELEQDLILRAISYHNRMDLPLDETDRCLMFSRMLRDADKLDIWQVFTDYYAWQGGASDTTIIHNLPDTPGISDRICADLLAGKTARYGDAKNLNDFKLLQVGWIFDINFAPTFRRIQERDYMAVIRNALPQSGQVAQIFSEVQSYLAGFTTDNTEAL